MQFVLEIPAFEKPSKVVDINKGLNPRILFLREKEIIGRITDLEKIELISLEVRSCGKILLWEECGL